MRKVWPHEFFRLDFDQMLEEGKRQEKIHTANAGEYSLVRSMHTYFDSEVLPFILNDDWVYEAASTLALLKKGQKMQIWSILPPIYASFWFSGYSI